MACKKFLFMQAMFYHSISHMKIISFGPRPMNFLACNAPIKQLYNLGVEIEENSELDLFEAFNKHAGDERIPAIVKEMEEELGAGNKKPDIQQCNSILADNRSDELTESTVNIHFAGYRNALRCQTAVHITWHKTELCLECRPAFACQCYILAIATMLFDPVF